MALTFASANTQRVECNDVLGLTTHPFSMGCWFRPSGFAVNHMIMTLGDHTADNEFFRIYSDSSAIRFDAAGGGAVSTASTATGPSNGVWCHVAAVAASSVDRRVFINGGSKGTNTTDRDPFGAGLTRFSIGRSAQASPQYTNGDLAEAAVWNAALTDDEVAALGKGFSPLLIRPQSLVAYYPLGRGHISGASHLDRWRGGFSLAEGGTGSPSVADHPRIIYPVGAI